ncbi:hypothetical protein C0993_003175 [Termitomyces sp. T159_Od127]|nr:hypothetical protein C0993_003175 [Termitomyces sp. T159_Od127]
MGAYYDEIEIEDMTWDPVKGVYHYPCPCGDRFEISRKQLANYEDIATCPSCSLIIRVVYDPLDFEDETDEEDDDGAANSEGEETTESEHDDEHGIEDALDKLTISEDAAPRVVTVSA